MSRVFDFTLNNWSAHVTDTDLQLHEEHLGMSRAKSLARAYLWWIYLGRDIDDLIERCSACSSTRSTPMETSLHPGIWASRPGQRVLINFSEYKGQAILVIIYTNYKWLEDIPVKPPTSSNTIEKLQTLLA